MELLRRAAASAIDVVISSTPFIALAGGGWLYQLSAGPGSAEAALVLRYGLLLGAAFSFLSFLLLELFFIDQTPGKRLLRISVLRQGSLARASRTRQVIRELIWLLPVGLSLLMLNAWPLLPPLLLLIFARDQRSIADRIAGTWIRVDAAATEIGEKRL